MEKGNVIPVIGSELLMINYEGTLQPFYAVLAKLLAKRLDLEITANDPADVIYAFSANGKNDMTEPYYEIRDILKEYKFEIPETLRLLAGIEAFNIFITTTFDDLMLKALNEVRFNGASKTTKLFYQKGTNRYDIIDSDSPQALNAPVVYHMFGTAQSQPYVVTEDDLLEFEYFWQDEDRRPQKIASLLKDKYILILGCNFQNWLSRFFLYTFKSASLFKSSEILTLIADGKSRSDEELVLFLSRCQTHLYQDEAGGFINELNRRWKEYAAENKSSPNTEETLPEYTKGSLFLSYASEDRDFVLKLKSRFEAKGINAWFDKKELEAGDFFQKKILQNIEESALFLPVISHNVLTPDRRFFRLEWNHAIEEAKFRPSGTSFIIPVNIDDTGENETFIPEEFKKVHWHYCKNGVISDEFVDLIVGYIRNVRRSELLK